MEDWADKYKVDVPEGASGEWSIVKFRVSKDESDFDRMRSMFGGRGRFARPGTYTSIKRGGSTIMSDTHDEISDHRETIRVGSNAGEGIYLINGLGIGMVADNILKNNPNIKVRVIEISPDVIALVAPHYKAKYGDRFEAIEADALTYQPAKGERFVGVWHDIWDNICSDNLEQMKILHRKYGRRSEWQGSWCRSECEYYNRRYAA